jgi:hypothetical protein
MINSFGSDPKQARALRGYDDAPTLDEQEAAHLQQEERAARKSARDWARQRRELLLAESIALRLVLRQSKNRTRDARS